MTTTFPMAFRFPRARLLAGALALGAVLGACSEDLESGKTCSTLCPGTDVQTRDVTLDAVTLDATVPGVLETGLEPINEVGLQPGLPLVGRPEVETRVVVRFDTLPQRYTPNTGGASDTTTAPITAVTNAGVRFRFDTLRSTISDSVEIRAYDVDDATDDTTTAGIEAKVVPANLVASVRLAKPGLRDTILVPLPSAFVVGKLQAADPARRRIRLAFAVSGARPIVIRVVPTTDGSALGPLLRYTAADTTDKFEVLARFNPRTATTDETYRLADFFTLPKRAPERTDAVLAIGGLPARRALLRFTIPDNIRQAAAIVQAELRLVQVDDPLPALVDTVRADTTSSGLKPRVDTVTVLPLIGVGADVAISDPVRAGQLARRTVGSDLFSVGALAVLPQTGTTATTVRRIDVAGLIRKWNTISATQPRYLVLVSRWENAQAATAYFWSTAAPDPTVRPQLFIRYIPRVGYGIP